MKIVTLLDPHLVELEERLAKGEALPSTGGVYFECMKIGVTRKEGPQVRLQQLSRYVTWPFISAAWLPTPTPFLHEAEAHRHFGAKRIMAPGAGIEFFHVVAEEVVAYVGGSPAACDERRQLGQYCLIKSS